MFVNEAGRSVTNISDLSVDSSGSYLMVRNTFLSYAATVVIGVSTEHNHSRQDCWKGSCMVSVGAHTSVVG